MPRIANGFCELVDLADVVVENFRPGVMDRAGLGYEALRKRNPRLIYAASSGYGQTGPYVTRPGQDYLVQALSGAMWLTGRSGDPPLRDGHRRDGSVHRTASRGRQSSPRLRIATERAKASASTSTCSPASSLCSSRNSPST